jgi:hypothetical protein
MKKERMREREREKERDKKKKICYSFLHEMSPEKHKRADRKKTILKEC